MVSFSGQGLLQSVRIEKPGHGGKNHPAAGAEFLIVQTKAVLCDEFAHYVLLLWLFIWGIILQKNAPEKLAFPAAHAV